MGREALKIVVGIIFYMLLLGVAWWIGMFQMYCDVKYLINEAKTLEELKALFRTK